MHRNETNLDEHAQQHVCEIVNVWACTCYRKYQEENMRAPEGQSLDGAIIIPEGYFS